MLGFVQGSQIYAVFDTDETDYYSCAATNEPYGEYHFSDWISDGNVDAVKSSFPDWIAQNQIDQTLEVKNEIVAQVTIQGYLPVISPEGVAQVFASSECRRYATGLVNSVYVRLNRSFGINDGVNYGSASQPSECMNINTPSTEYPDDAYGVDCYVNFVSQESDGYTEGQIVECYCRISEDVTNYKKVFP